MKPYHGVSVLDCTHELGRYVGRLFADLGAIVKKIEPPAGALDRIYANEAGNTEARAEFEYFHASKESIFIDLNTEKGLDQFKGLATESHIVVLEAGGYGYGLVNDLKRVNPSAVITVISPFGETGPSSNALGGDLILQAAGGIAWLSGTLGQPPLRLPGCQATMIAGVYAAVATGMALFNVEQTGEGHLVQISAQECIAHSLQNAIQVWDFERKISMRGGEGTRDASEDIFPCKDGFVFLAAPRSLGNSWSALLGWIAETGHPAAEKMKDPKWADRAWRLTKQARVELRAILEPFMAQYKKEELTREAIARKIVMGPVNTLPEVFEDPQLAFREYFEELTIDGQSVLFPGAPYKLSEPVWHINAAPPVQYSSN